jgi:hypothetical protein
MITNSLVKAFAKGGLTFLMTKAEWGTLMMQIDTIAQSFDSAYRDMVLAAFRGPSQQLCFQPPVPSFDMEAIEIDIGTPMDEGDRTGKREEGMKGIE